jgi:hypothetical protein
LIDLWSTSCTLDPVGRDAHDHALLAGADIALVAGCDRLDLGARPRRVLTTTSSSSGSTQGTI